MSHEPLITITLAEYNKLINKDVPKQETEHLTLHIHERALAELLRTHVMPVSSTVHIPVRQFGNIVGRAAFNLIEDKGGYLRAVLDRNG